MQQKIIYPAVFILTLSLLTALLISACSTEKDAPEFNISMGVPDDAMSSLIWLANELGYFEDQGIQASLSSYPSGKRALAAMLEGKLDVAATAEPPFVISIFKNKDLRLYATMGQSNNETRMIARRDLGINKESDLKNKTIGTQKGSAVHFFLDSFLLHHQLDQEKINIVFMKAEDLPVALANGEIDAFTMREPFLSIARNAIGADKIIEFSVPGLYTRTYNLVARKSYAKKYPGALSGILKAMKSAADFADENPQKAIHIIAKQLSLPEKTMESVFNSTRFTLSLNQGLLITLQEEIRWAVDTGLVDRNDLVNGSIPDILQHIDPKPLQMAVPGATGLIGIRETGL